MEFNLNDYDASDEAELNPTSVLWGAGQRESRRNAGLHE
jgi:hypothetical protein